MNKETNRSKKVSPQQRVISGKITVEQSDQGVANLVVEAVPLSNGKHKRLGSVCTDDLGTFNIETLVPAQRRYFRKHTCDFNLQLFVLAPERDDFDRNKRLLFCSELRKNAGHHEHFCIELSVEALETVGIKVKTADKTPVEAIETSHSQEKEVQLAIDKVFESNIETVTERRTLFRNEILEHLEEELSTVTKQERASDQFVETDEKIEPKHLQSVKNGIDTLTTKESDPDTGDRVSKFLMKSRLLLTEEQKELLTGNSSQPVTLSEEEVEEKLDTELDKPAVIYRRHLEPDPCRPKTDAEKCLDSDDESQGSNNGDEGEDNNGDNDGDFPPVDVVEESSTDLNGNRSGANISFDKDTAIASLLGRQTSPEEPVEFGVEEADLESPLTAGGVSDAIKQVVFSPGPADVPAFHDFHDLQIAFEPVWQEALDDKYLEDVEAAYDEIVERGGAPALQSITSIINSSNGSGLFDKLFDKLSDLGFAANSGVPASVISAVYISLEEWRALPAGSRKYLKTLATQIETLRNEILEELDPKKLPDIKGLGIAELMRAAQTKDTIARRAKIQILLADVKRIVSHARRLLIERESGEPFKPTHTVIEKLRHHRNKAYPFRYFAASSRHRSVNFGILVTYRQKWTPISYQVGELTNTIPLAPKEIRKFSKKTVVKTKRSRQEIESNLVSRQFEAEEKSRAEAEIVSRATAKTGFSHSVQGTMNFGGDESPIGGSATTTSTFTRNAEKHSESVKKEFREAILKSAEEYKNERKVEVTTEESFEEEITESGEIQNPNDEIPVTFLFYELQRRYKINEKIHRLQSVVLVAQEVPRPSDIDKAWLMRYDWIINRVLLDDSFRPALSYVSTSLISEEIALKEMRQALFRQRKLVEELKEDVADRRALTGLRYGALQRQIERTAKSADSGGGLFGGIGNLVGGIPLVGDAIQGGIDLFTGGGGPDEAAQIREGAARDAYDRERREEQDLATYLANALSTLDAMQSDYNERLADHLRQMAQCERLIAHIIQYIMYYMQAIWSYEQDDQRFLRLRNVPVPVFEKDKQQRHYVVNPNAMKAYSDISIGNTLTYEAEVDMSIFQPPSAPQDIKTKPLSEVADLNRPMGFMGNYMIFPMIESNPITEFMMDPYVTLAEGEYGVSDPDPLGNMTLEEFSEYICCLKRHFEEQKSEENGESESPGDDVEVPEGEERPDPFEELKPFLRETLKKLLERSLRNNEEVIVPTDSLYIEALPGAHSVMEKFKHLHRQIDVKSAQEDTRQKAIENIRRAQRILDDQLEDPDIETKYVFEGDGTVTVVPPDGGSGSVNPSPSP